MSAEQLPDLTLPRTNIATARLVMNAYMREVVRAFTTLPAQALTPSVRVLYTRTLALVQRQLKEDPRRVVWILRQPTHAALLWTLRRETHAEGDRARLDLLLTELCLLTQLALALHGVVSADTMPTARPSTGWPQLRSLGGGFVLTIGDGVESVVFTPHGLLLRQGLRSWTVSIKDGRNVEVPEGAPLTVARPYHSLVDGISLALTDNNPLSMFEAHPDKFGNAIDLGGHSIEEWQASLRESFATVDKYLPLIGEEMRLILKTIVPVGYHDQKHLSASYQEAVGTIYMTLHPNQMTMTEALIHEFQHNKINAAFHLDPMLHNAFWPLYSSPVRPDPRPLHGVVLAVHAFQPVAKLYEEMANQGHELASHPAWRKRFRDIIRMDRAGAETVLKNAQATPIGAALFMEMAELDSHLRDYEAAHWQEAVTAEPPPLPE
jgi:HEXXH motif-containing protein